MKNKLIIFDCFGVIFDEIAKFVIKKHCSEEEFMVFKEQICPLVDYGDVTLDELLEQIAQKGNVPIEQVYDEWNALIHLNYDLIERIKELKLNYDVVLLSNAAPNLVEDLFEKYDIVKYFDKIYVSSKLHMIKPHKDIFEFVLSDIDYNKYQEIYFVDDRITNFKEIGDLPIKPILFKDISSIENL